MTDKRTHILLVEDDPATRKLSSIRLEEKGYQVSTAEDGLEGQLKARNLDIDIMLIDMMLPEMSGAELLSLVREEKDMTQLPVILMSSIDDEKRIEKYFKLGATDYFTKPVDFEKLDQVIKKHLK